MNYVPPRRRVVPFDRTYRGTTGNFQTDTSFSVQYLQTSLRVDQLGQLSTAAEVLDFDETHFDELIQRDIDRLRVKKIAKGYLSSRENRPIFFPPLIVCVGLLDPGTGRLRPRYETVDRERTDDNGQDTLIATFDNDGFQVKLPVAEEGQSERRVTWEGEAVPFYDFAAELLINTRRTKLIVLDGQHRLEALRLLQHTAEGRRVIQNIEMPVCIIWSSSANVGEAESIVADYRDLFVTINSEPMRVSGHFLTLLEDATNTSLVVRELADAWKHEQRDGWSRLHLLEWNTRENERTEQRTRTFSITTISIVAKAIREYLFGVWGLPAKALDLCARDEDFERADPDFQPSELADDRPLPDLSKIVSEQIRAELVPALSLLLRTLRPYADLEALAGAAFARLAQTAAVPDPAYLSVERQLSRFVYSIDDLPAGEVIGAYANFRQWARNSAEDDVYFLAVFQQGLLRVWLQLLRVLDPVSAVQVAAGVAAAMNAFAVQANEEGPFVGVDVLYCRRVLWKGDRVNFGSEWAKAAWTNILMATLAREDVRAAALQELSNDPGVRLAFDTILRVEASRAAQKYVGRLFEEIRRDTYTNLSEYFGEIGAGEMRILRVEDPPEFEARIRANAQPRFRAALTMFSNQLGLQPADLEF